jgi:diguanylate cyclase (GGDEF)-like protein
MARGRTWTSRRALGAVACLLAAALALFVANRAAGVGGVTVGELVLPLIGELLLVAATAATAARAITVRHDRAAWAALALAVGFWTLADLYKTIAFWGVDARPSPSAADALYLLFYPAAYAGLALLIRPRLRGFAAMLWLDGLIGAVGVAALGVSVLYRAVLAQTDGDAAAVATNLAYPLGDAILLGLVAGVIALCGYRPARAWLLLGGGLALMAGADVAYVAASAHGSAATAALGPVWVLAMLLVAAAAWHRDTDARKLELDGWRVLLVPLVFATATVAVLLYGQTGRVPALGAVLAAVTLGLVIVRTGLTFAENRRLEDSRRQAVTDELTGLANRRSLHRRLEEALAASRRTGASAGLLVLDLDRFKELNDTLGHHAGDMLLAQLGPRLRDALADGEVAGRLGGDEFAVVVGTGATSAGLADAAARLHRALAGALLVEGISLHARASIGGALLPEHCDDAAALLRCADVAMYQAKQAGTGYELYRPERDVNSRDRLRLLEELRTGLGRGELVVHYQPKCRVGDGAVVGVEALIRWEHAERGLLRPAAFLGPAEEAGLMRDITRAVLEQALVRLAAWSRDGIELGVAVNLAMPNLLDSRLPDDVAELLASSGTPADRLTLEITEDIAMTDPARVLDVLGRLRALGVHLSLDDFGAGSASFAHLRRLPVEELKVDRSFVSRMTGDRGDGAIVRATIGLAHDLGLRVVAEGVEDAETWEALRRLGCDEAQGYLLSRPLPPDALRAWLDVYRGVARRSAAAA